MQNRPDPPERQPGAGQQAPVEEVNPKSEQEQIEDVAANQGFLAPIREVDELASRERERIQQGQLERYGELVHREDEPLYGLEAIEGGADEQPKEEPAAGAPGALNLTWGIVLGGTLLFWLFFAILWYSVWLRDPDEMGTVNTPLSPPPYQLDQSYGPKYPLGPKAPQSTQP